MNNTNLVGRITKDLELRFTQNNKAVCNFDIAVNRIGQEGTDFINCTIYGKQAENLKKYQGKGSLIAVSGSIRVDSYKDKDGNNRYKTYVLANSIEYLSNKQSSEQVNNKKEVTDDTQVYADFGEITEVNDSDLPF